MPKAQKQPKPDTAYLYCIDEAALGALLPLQRVGTLDVEIPGGEVPQEVRTHPADACNVIRAKGSSAGYEVMAGLQNAQAFENGDLIGGTRCLPITAFHERMYEGVIARMAEVLAGYRRIVAHPFECGKPGYPRASVANRGVQFYDDMAWCAPGRIAPEVVVWDILGNAPVPEPEPEPEPEAEAEATPDVEATPEVVDKLA